MSRTWTRRGTYARPPEPDRRPDRLFTVAALVFALLPLSCHRKNEDTNRISPIQAHLDIQDPYVNSPDPAVYVVEGQSQGELAIVHVKLHASAAPLAFDALTLEFTYDFTLVQIGDTFEVNPQVLGSCHAGTACDPLCLDNAALANQGLTTDVDGKAHFVMGVSARAGCPIAKTGRCNDITQTTCTTNADCPHDTCNTGTLKCQATGTTCDDDTDCLLAETCNSQGTCTSTNSVCAVNAECIQGESCVPVLDTTLVTLGFIAATTIDSPGTRIELFTKRLPGGSNPDPSAHGDCEILSGAVDLGIPCEDGNAFLTASR